MKKVRFETPKKDIFSMMRDSECHSPRPFLGKQVPGPVPDLFSYQRVLPYSDDPVLRYESSDSIPYPTARKTPLTNVAQRGSKYIPSNELELSLLDSSDLEPRRHQIRRFSNDQNLPEHNVSTPSYVSSARRRSSPVDSPRERINMQSNIVSSEKSKENTPPNVLTKDDSFFLRKDNLSKYQIDAARMRDQFQRFDLFKENDLLAKTRPSSVLTTPIIQENMSSTPQHLSYNKESDCECHHCIKITEKVIQCNKPLQMKNLRNKCQQMIQNSPQDYHQCPCIPLPPTCFHCSHNYIKNSHQQHHDIQSNTSQPTTPQNAIDKKIWAIENFEKSKKPECMDLDKQTNVTKEKREPTVADLFKIIKLQNEQLQLLQEKVDKFISATNQTKPNTQPVNYVTEHVALQTIDTEHKISIGVMTSFEMVRTSTVINKEIVKQGCENAQIQCNQSQISIKEVISKSQPGNLNVLDGIMPVTQTVQSDESNYEEAANCNEGNVLDHDANVMDDKTYNEQSLYNVQVDNVTTPYISPEQSLYLDVRDYSDSESSSDDQSNVGWTYYNKVMNRVNGLLQDSDMPSSASALYRNTRQQCVQMQIDKTNVSVTKRVKFGDDPLGLHQPHVNTATDISLKMNQLAAKYLNRVPTPTRQTTTPVDMSFATKTYMERHRILQGLPQELKSQPVSDMPRFLDITALKQQPKLL